MRILITAGATWVKIDDLRIITNRFTGKTGLFLARGLKSKGHLVTFLVNPHCLGKLKGIKTIYYHYFDEFKEKVIRALKIKSYDVVIHMAAVSDYKLKTAYETKLPSGKKNFVLKLRPTEKIIKRIRTLAKDALLIQFKLESKRKKIVDKAYRSLKENKSDFVVANALEDLSLGYKAMLIDKKKNCTLIASKEALLEALNKVINRSR